MENKIIKRIQKEFNKTPDLTIKKVKLSFFDTVYVAYLESVSSGDKVNDYILKNLSTLSSTKEKKIYNTDSILPGPNTISINNLDEIEFFITNGFAIIIRNNDILAIEAKADINRGISTPDSEPAVNGPKDAFNENYQINLGLIKRRLKSHDLKTEEFIIGRKTSTKIGVLYFEDIAEDELINNIVEKIKKIDIDGITDSSTLAQLITDENKTNFPTFIETERPDTVSKALLEGKVVILVDTTPFAIILPAFFADFINPVVDSYSKSNNINFLKIVRFTCFFLSMLVPAVYISLLNYNQETIPTKLLVSFAIQRDGVPFPAVFEALFMLVTFDILKESDIRFPNSYGSAVSILGALILGDAAVNAGIVSPIMIIVIALTFISSLIFTEVEITNALRKMRFTLFFAASFFGILGVALGFVYFLVRINNIDSFGKPYFYPLMPFDKTYLYKTLLKKPAKQEKRRSKILTSKNVIRQGENG